MSIVQKTVEASTMSGETLDDILGTASSVAIVPSGSNNGTFMERKNSELDFLDTPPGVPPVVASTDEPPAGDKPPVTATADDVMDVLKELDDALSNKGADDDDDPEKNKAGRKPALIETIGKLVEKGTLTLFEGEDDISKYTNDDFVELIEANIKDKVQERATNAPMEIFSKLDPKLQDIVAYNLKGGKDILNILKNVTSSQEIADLNMELPKDQERLVREYYRSVDWTESDIDDEVASLIDREELQKRANQFKPKIDAQQASILQAKIKEQDDATKRADEMKSQYAANIFKVLDNPTLNGIPLNPKTQAHLYNGIVNSGTYQDKSGNPTNTLGHLIEDLQFGPKPDHALLLEAFWLMSNPTEYRQNFLALAEKGVATDVYRQLKTAESTKNGSSSAGFGKDEPARRTPAPGARPIKRNILSRS
jgi:hypothetical protein